MLNNINQTYAIFKSTSKLVLELNSDNKQPSGDFIAQRKTSPAVTHHDKRDRHDDEGNILHKKHSEKEKKPASLLEVKSCKTKESVKSHTNPSDGMEAMKSTHKSTTKEKESAQEEGIRKLNSCMNIL